jgi:DNA-binding NarL/FixJ family response regulator/DNA-binding SARP family transcriptional activator
MEYRILGPLEAAEDGRPIPLGRLKERLVLAVLLLNANEFVSRERLIDDLWGESPPSSAPKAVNVYVSQLRKTLARSGADPIATADGGYRIRADAVDAVRAQQLVTTAHAQVAAGDVRAAAETLREALALWRGPTLAGLVLESRGRDQVVQLDELRLGALMDRIDCDLASGRHEDVLGELRVLVAEHPLRERLRGQLMLALYRAGRQAEALEVYQQARETLVEELGIEPGPALQRLQRAILTQDTALERTAANVVGGEGAGGVSGATTRVVLADDHHLLREGVRRMLETSPQVEVVADCEDLNSLLAAVDALRPDVVVTDIRMPPGNLDEGIRASDQLRHLHPEVGVVVLSQYVEPDYALALFDAGTERRAYLLKERVRDVDQLVAAIHAVRDGGSVVDPKVVEALVAEKTRRAQSPLNELTQRERDVLREMAAGKNNAAIADALHLSDRTVEKAIHAIFVKLGIAWESAVHRRVKAVLLYLSGSAAETRFAESSN